MFQAPSLEEHVDYHFIAFVEKDGILYDLDGRKPAPVNCGPTCKETFLKVTKFNLRCILDLMALKLVTTCDLVIIFQRPFFNLKSRSSKNPELDWSNLPQNSNNGLELVKKTGVQISVDKSHFFLSRFLHKKLDIDV